MDRRRPRAYARSLAIALPLLLAACGAGGPTPAVSPSASPVALPSASGSPGPSPTVDPSPSPGGLLSAAQLRLALLGAFGSLWYCDPDEYPVARDDEAALAAERFPEIRADAESWAAITAALGVDPAGASFAPGVQLAIYRQWKVLNAIALTPFDDGFAFDELFGPTDPNGQLGEHISGTIAGDGTITIGRREASGQPMCPICLARGTAILTPDGPVAVESLRAGRSVWTLDSAGRRVPATVLAVASTPVPASHRIVRLVLSDGRTVAASPGHPLADGRTLGSLELGDVVDGARVVSADLAPYGDHRTYDLLVSGPTGDYLAGNGIPLGSTIKP